jgi:tripartite motif-containing protein 71
VGQEHRPTCACSFTYEHTNMGNKYSKPFKLIIGKRGRGDGEFFHPQAVCTDEDDHIYVADTNNHRIQVFNVDGSFLYKFGKEGSQAGKFNDPMAICMGSGEHRDCIVIADYWNERVVIVKKNGDHVRSIPCGGCTNGVSVDSSNRIFVSKNYYISVWDWNGQHIFSFGSQGSQDGQFEYARKSCIDKERGIIFIADQYNNRIQLFDLQGTFMGKIGSEGSSIAQLNRSTSVGLDSLGNLIIADSRNHRLSAWSWHNGQSSPLGVFAKEGSNQGEFKYPKGVCIDSLGRIIVAETENHRIQIVERKMSQTMMMCSLLIDE